MRVLPLVTAIDGSEMSNPPDAAKRVQGPGLRSRTFSPRMMRSANVLTPTSSHNS